MRTSCEIGILNEKTMEIKWIYCHHDGYLDGVGHCLLDNYQDEDKINKMINLGCMSSIGAEVEHDINKPGVDVCEFYHRDLGQEFDEYENMPVTEFLSNFSANDFPIKYIYLYIPGYGWIARDNWEDLNYIVNGKNNFELFVQKDFVSLDLFEFTNEILKDFEY